MGRPPRTRRRARRRHGAGRPRRRSVAVNRYLGMAVRGLGGVIAAHWTRCRPPRQHPRPPRVLLFRVATAAGGSMQTDAEPFLQRIRAYPDDDVPRLIFADWLDERAAALPARDRAEAHDRAEFIRIQ